MNTLQQEEYISIKQGCQQLKLEICGGREYKAEKDEFYRQVSAQLEELDYTLLIHPKMTETLCAMLIVSFEMFYNVSLFRLQSSVMSSVMLSKCCCNVRRNVIESL